MPTYEYKCLKCGYTFENFQGINEVTIPKCPQCESKAERKISGGGGFLLKGNGFYKNDYRHEPCCSRGEACDNPKKCCEN